LQRNKTSRKTNSQGRFEDGSTMRKKERLDKKVKKEANVLGEIPRKKKEEEGKGLSKFAEGMKYSSAGPKSVSVCFERMSKRRQGGK